MNRSEDSEALTRVMLDAERRGIPIEIVPRAQASSLVEAAALLKIPASQLVKTLVIKRSDGTFLFALIPGGRKLDWAKFRTVLGVNKLSLPDVQTAFEVTHYRRGTITPFGAHTVLPVFVDSSVYQEPVAARIALGSGDPHHALMVNPELLLAGFSAVSADISVPEQ